MDGGRWRVLIVGESSALCYDSWGVCGVWVFTIGRWMCANAFRCEQDLEEEV